MLFPKNSVFEYTPPTPPNLRFRLAGSPTGSSSVRWSHLPLPTSRLLENWFKGTQYVQQIRIARDWSDVDRFFGRVLLVQWHGLQHRIRHESLLPLQQRLLTCRCRIHSLDRSTLSRGYEPDGIRSRDLYSAGVCPESDCNSDSGRSDLSAGHGSCEQPADVLIASRIRSRMDCRKAGVESVFRLGKQSLREDSCVFLQTADAEG